MNSLPKHRAMPTNESAYSASMEAKVVEVRMVYADHCEVSNEADGVTFDAVLPKEGTSPMIGDRAYVIKDQRNDQWLVAALYPAALPANVSGDVTLRAAPLVSFDRNTRTLTLDATRLEIKAIESIELRCGDARFRLTMQGAVQLAGETITSSAIGEHRIEGATIDLN